MKAKIIFSGILFFFWPAFVSADLGRPEVSNSTVVTANGVPLRAGHLLLFKGNWSTAGDVDYYRYLKNTYNLNAIRAMVYRENRSEYTATGWYEPSEVLATLDTAVQMAKQENMYIIIDYHPTPEGHMTIDGHPNDLENFWNLVAPRYKDETHVIYELTNEPVAWSSDNYSAAAITYQRNGYDLIRSLAPNTHIILWSFANVGTVMKSKVDQAPEINYANASVGYHFYQRTAAHRTEILNCKSAYPVIMTEFLPGFTGTGTDLEQVNDMTYWHEQNGISWVVLFAPPLYETEGIDVHWSNTPSSTNLLQNPNFESGETSWSFFNDASSDLNQFSIVSPGMSSPNAAKISLPQISPSNPNIQLNQKDITLKPNTGYRLTFDASSNTGHDFTLHLHKDVSPYTNYGLNNQAIDLTTAWQNHSIDFTTQNFTSPVADGRLRLWFANQAQSGDEYYFDNFNLVEYAGDASAPGSPAGLNIR